MNKTNTRTFSTWSGILLLLCVWSTIGLATEVYYVSPQGPGGDFKSWAQAADNIQAALDVAEDGDTVRVASGEYVLSAQIEITNSISLIGESGPVETVINGGYTPGGATTNRCLLVSGGDPFITGFTFSNGASFYEDGGGILMANATLSNCVVRNNRAYLLEKGSRLGGGISASGSTIVDSWIIENLIEAATFNTSGWSGGGGGINLTSSSMTDCVISNNAIVVAMQVPCWVAVFERTVLALSFGAV